jgi:hypothetical protein
LYTLSLLFISALSLYLASIGQLNAQAVTILGAVIAALGVLMKPKR